MPCRLRFFEQWGARPADRQLSANTNVMPGTVPTPVRSPNLAIEGLNHLSTPELLTTPVDVILLGFP